MSVPDEPRPAEVLPPLLSEFFDYFTAVRGRSPLTVREYRYDLVLFFRFLLRRRGLADRSAPLEQIGVGAVDLDLLRSVTLNDLYAYMTWLGVERKGSPAMRARKVASLKAFFRYLKTRRQLVDTDPTQELESPRQVRRLPRHLDLSESRQLLQASAPADGTDESSGARRRESIRNYCILTLFLNCGLRLSELCSIDLAQLREETLTVLGKGAKERTLYLNGACQEALRDWLEVRPAYVGRSRESKALFLGRGGHRLQPKTVQGIVKRLLREAGLDPARYSTHKLRHTAATLMYKYGKVDIRALQRILGHASIATTEIYTHTDDEQLHAAVESHPLASVRRQESGSPSPSPSKDGV